jgi:hypothetical protein
MGGIPGAKFTLIRTVSMILNLTGIILVLVFIGTGITNATDNMSMITAPIIGTIMLIFLLKDEHDAIDDHRPVILAATISLCLVLEIILGYTINSAENIWNFYIPAMGAMFGLIVAWHYTLTIYNNEKQRYWLSSGIFFVLWLVGGWVIIGLLVLVPAILVALATIMGTFAEKQLVKQGLMKFI